MPTIILSVPITSETSFMTFELSNGAGFSQSSEIIINNRVVPISNICFPSGTPIKTDQGFIDIDKINAKIHTINSNKIVAVTETRSLDDSLVCFPANSLAPNVPSQVTIVSNEHLIQHPETKMMLKAKDYLSIGANIKKISYNDEFLYNVLLERHHIMEVNNMVCETLFPYSMIALLYEKLSTVEEEAKSAWIETYNRVMYGIE